MKDALWWVPTLDGRTVPQEFFSWQVHRFLSAHGGRGHIIGLSGTDWPSRASLIPERGGVWHCYESRAVGKKSAPAAIHVEIPLPVGSADPALELLNTAHKIGPISRLILHRPAGLPIRRCLSSLATLADSVTENLWISLKSFGWESASYLVATNPDVQIDGVPDSELWHLIRLGEWLGRPVALSDFSGNEPIPLASLNRYDEERSVPSLLRALPIWGRTR